MLHFAGCWQSVNSMHMQVGTRSSPHTVVALPGSKRYTIARQTIAGAVKAGPSACQELDALLQRLSGMAAVLPGNYEVKQLIQGVLEAMEQQNPHPVPLRSRTSPGSAAKQPSSTRSSSTPEAAGLQPVPELLGDWDLVFASNGTVVTRTQFAQTLVSLAAKIPGVGLKDIVQSLTVDPQHPGCIRSTNEAEFGLGPFGSWQVGITGSWSPAGLEQQDSDTAWVEFDRFSVKLVGWLGLTMPQQLPQVSIPLPSGGSRSRHQHQHSQQQQQQQQQQQRQPQQKKGDPVTQQRRVAVWTTSYLDDTWRVGRAGSSGNVFLFRRRTQSVSS